jgi:hypothetical protein
MLPDLVAFEADLLKSALRVDAAYRDIVRGKSRKPRKE